MGRQSLHQFDHLDLALHSSIKSQDGILNQAVLEQIKCRRAIKRKLGSIRADKWKSMYRECNCHIKKQDHFDEEKKQQTKYGIVLKTSDDTIPQIKAKDRKKLEK